MRPNECVWTTPGHVLQWYGPNFHTGPAQVMFSQSERTTFFGSTLFVWVENILVSGKAGPLPLLRRLEFLLCGAVVILAAVAGERQHLWAGLVKATFTVLIIIIILRVMCAPEWQSQNHPQSSYWKQRWGPFEQALKLRKCIFIFGLVSAEDVCSIWVEARRRWKKMLCWRRRVWVTESGPRAERLRHLGLQVAYCAPGAN